MGARGCWRLGRMRAAEIVVSAAVGVVGLEATYEAIKLGKVIALSNKEVLVAAGELVMAAVEKSAERVAAGGQRAQRGAPVLARRDAWGSAADCFDGFGRAVPEDAAEGFGERDDGAGAGSSQLADGEPDHD